MPPLAQRVVALLEESTGLSDRALTSTVIGASDGPGPRFATGR
jgi:hypothetical protein